MIYSVLRLGLFAVCFGLGLWAGLGSWLLVVGSAFAAWGLSYVLLARPRDAAALQIAGWSARRAAGHRFPDAVEADAAHEDAVLDAADVVAAHAAEDLTPHAVDDVAARPADVADHETAARTADAADDVPAGAIEDYSASPRPSSAP